MRFRAENTPKTQFNSVPQLVQEDSWILPQIGKSHLIAIFTVESCRSNRSILGARALGTEGKLVFSFRCAADWERFK